MIRLRTLLALVLGFAVIGMLSNTAHATLLGYEPFNYTAGMSATGNGGMDWKGNWSQSLPITSPGMSYDSLDTTGNKAEGSTGPFRLFSGSAISSGSIWVSFIAKASEQNTAVSISLLQSYSAVVIVGDQYSPYWSIRGADKTVGKTATSTSSDKVSTFLLARIDLNGASDASAYLWINPDLSAGAPSVTTAAASLSDIGQAISSIDGISMGLFGRPGDMLDEIRVGTTFADVSPTTTPEPASGVVALLGLGGVLMIGRRRQRVA